MISIRMPIIKCQLTLCNRNYLELTVDTLDWNSRWESRKSKSKLMLPSFFAFQLEEASGGASANPEANPDPSP